MKASEQQALIPQEATPDTLIDLIGKTQQVTKAAAVVLTNTAVPVHIADVIAAIGKMLKAKLQVPAIAAALGYAEIEVRRLARLARLDPRQLVAQEGQRSIDLRAFLRQLVDLGAQHLGRSCR